MSKNISEFSVKSKEKLIINRLKIAREKYISKDQVLYNLFSQNISYNEKIAQASEIALEHSLGLTCDPIEGYVQIPCIERNAIFALKAINSCSLAAVINCETSKINFDDIVQTMFETGKDLQKGYKETSKKGMSKIKIEC